MDTTWDLIIVGGGIAGLETCRRFLAKRPKASVLVLEKYNYLGGRMVTFKGHVGVKKVSWEIGAGRVCRSHPLTRELVAHMGCHLVPIGSQMSFVDGGCLRENMFAPGLLSTLEALPAKELASSTLWDLTCRVWGGETAGRFWAEYPYDAEVRVLRADMGLVAFKKEMAGNSGFSVCAEGFGEVCRRLAGQLRKAGATIHTGHEVLEVRSGSVVCRHDGREVIHHGKKIVVAVHSSGLRHIRGFGGWPLLKKVQMRPLVRIYGVFPKGRDGKVWFEGLGKVVTSSDVRYFIPIDEKKGVAMISYTDGHDAEGFLKLGDSGRGQEAVDTVMGHLRGLFPGRDIPDPEMWRVHGWTDGCTYWLPGDYDPAAESKAAHVGHGIPGVYVVGESFSMRQAWIEGALEHVEQLWRLHGRDL